MILGPPDNISHLPPWHALSLHRRAHTLQSHALHQPSPSSHRQQATSGGLRRTRGSACWPRLALLLRLPLPPPPIRSTSDKRSSSRSWATARQPPFSFLRP